MSGAESVYVPRLLMDRRPVYHLRGRSRRLRSESLTGYEVRTRCGRLGYRVGYDGIERVSVHLVRRDHAALIGRICEPCYRHECREKGYR